MTAPLFYTDVVPDAGTVVLPEADARHAAALRLHPGETALLCDGAGRVARTTVAAVGTRGLELQVVAVSGVPAPRPIRVVQAVPKGERADLAVELLTETGATEIVPWRSQRAVADWRGKEQAKRQRWLRVARAAGMQSRRTHLPRVTDLAIGLPEVIGHGLVLHEEAATDLFDLDLPPGPLTVVVGPEGGLTASEVAGLQEQGAQVVGLGPLILRTSTAGAAACVWIRGFEKRRSA